MRQMHRQSPVRPTVGAGSRAFALGIGLNLVFIIIEIVFGLRARSLALVADAGHNLSDVLALGLSWGAATLASRAPTARRTYGMRRIAHATIQYEVGNHDCEQAPASVV